MSLIELQILFNSFKSGPDFSRDRTYTVLASIKKFQDLNFGPRGCRPDVLPAHVYCNEIKFNLLYFNYSFGQSS